MNEIKWEVLDQVSGSAQADILKGLLEAQGIQVVLSQESIGITGYAVAVGPLSEIQILVPGSQMEQASELLKEYRSGDLENLSYLETGEENSEETAGDQG